MKGSSLTFGIFMLIIGLIACQFGLLLTLHQTVLIDVVVDIVQNVEFIELIGIVLQLLGVIFIVTGFVISVLRIVAIKLESERRNLMGEILSILEERRQISRATRKCKFCGTEIAEGDMFCPACGKSQK